MNIEIISDQILSPKSSEVKINGVIYKDFKGLQLIIAKDGHGTLTIEHENGFIEAYKSELGED